MEDFWRLAKQPALRVWRQDPTPRWEANAAATTWALAEGVAADRLEACWDLLAAHMLGPAANLDVPWQLGEGGPFLSGQLIAVADGALLWWHCGQALSAALRAAGIAVWRIDPATKMLVFDPDAAPPVSVGPGVPSISLDEVRQRVHPEDRDAVVRATDEALRGHHAVDVVARYLQLDNSWKPMLTRRVARRDAQGRNLGLLGISLDISLLVKEREDMLRLRERIGSVSDAVGLGLWSREGPAGTADWNVQMYRIHHRDPAEGPPKIEEWFMRHVHPLDRERIRREQEEADRLWPAIYQTEFRIPTPEGGVRWVYSWTRREQKSGKRTAFGIHLDVTDRRGAEFELQQERERALFALGAAGVGVWRRVDATQSYWSEAMYRLRGLAPEDPRRPHDIARETMHPDDLPEYDRLITEHAKSGEPYEWEFRVILPDGTQRWLVTRGRAVLDAAGRLQYMAGVNVDITERRHAQTLAQERQRLEQARLTQSEFLARVSHELRTPLNAVLGFTQLLAYDPREPLSARQSDRVSRIDAAGRHLLALIDDVLDLARIDVDRQPLADEAIALDGLAREAMDWVAGMAGEAGLELRLNAPRLSGRVRGDRRRLGQIAINLLTNAVKYNRPQGWIEIASTERDVDGQRQCALIVRDSGRGLTPDQCQRVFEPFNRLGAELEGIEGTGIGLAIVRQLTERMGGAIELSSEPGVGSEFRIWLPADGMPTEPTPLASAPMPFASVPSPVPAAGSGRLRLLCVEDNPINQLLVRELIALRPAIEFHCVANGRAGIDEALHLHPDVMLLDMQLPDMHGLEVHAALRGRAELAHCRFIALSANAMQTDIDRAREQGFHDYWTKPIEVTRFLAGIDTLLER